MCAAARSHSFPRLTAMSGTAYAATMVTSKQIKNGTIQNVDVRNGTLTGAKVKDKSITKADLATGTVPAPHGGVKAYSESHNNQVGLAVSSTNVVQIYVPQPGHYLASAVTAISNEGDAETSLTYYFNGTTQDTKHVYVPKPGINSPSHTVLSLQLANTFIED